MEVPEHIHQANVAYYHAHRSAISNGTIWLPKCPSNPSRAAYDEWKTKLDAAITAVIEAEIADEERIERMTERFIRHEFSSGPSTKEHHPSNTKYRHAL